MRAREVIASLLRAWGCGDADQIIAALRASGYQIVPVEPTEEMKAYAHNGNGEEWYFDPDDYGGGNHDFMHFYQKLLSAIQEE